jgi:hypothetical protein
MKKSSISSFVYDKDFTKKSFKIILIYHDKILNNFYQRIMLFCFILDFILTNSYFFAYLHLKL